jgi:hypothetical protein
MRVTKSDVLAEPPISASPRRVRKVFADAGIVLAERWSADETGLGFRFSIIEMREIEREAAPTPDGSPAWLMEQVPWVYGSVIVSEAPGSLYRDDPDVMWLHASMAYTIDREPPTHAELVTLKTAVFGPKRHAYQVFPSEDEYVNHHSNALHLWGRRDGARLLPDFRIAGLI